MNRKILILSLFVLVALSSCEVFIVEEPVPVIVDDRDFFVGTYDVEEYSRTFDSYADYTLRIVKFGYDQSVYLKNFYGAGIHVIADVEGAHLFIPEQDVDGYHIEGDGFIDGHELRLSYSVHDYINNSVIDVCSVVAWK